MPDWNILVTDGLDEGGLDLLRAEARVDDRPNLSAADLLACVSAYDALIVRGRTRVTAEVLGGGTRLRVVGRAGVGVDNIDLDAARARGVVVVNAPLSTTVAVAELTFGLLLALAREIPRADAAMKDGRWLKKELEGVELAGKTLGLLGVGRIGAEVARRAAAFAMRVIGHDPLLQPDEIRRRGAEPVGLEELYAQSDFLSLHLPLTPETRGLLNAAAFARMRRGLRLVCAARGGIIDETALLAALNEGIVAGVALDVFAQEPPGASDLVRHPRVIATPHIGAQTAEAQSRAALDIAREVLAALRGESLRHRVA